MGRLVSYPLCLEPQLHEKPWGGRALEGLGRTLPGDTRFGESWEVADLAATSPSGGGGGSAHSRVTNGPLAGQTIRDLVSDHADALCGEVPRTADGAFPLLVKYLDAREHLSVQVHPSPDYAAAHPEAHLKSEAWYVVSATPGAAIYKGVTPGTSREAFRAAIEEGTVEDRLIRVPVRAGDCHYLPSGTCHALGEGLLVAEVQTPSDTTFRVFDWNREPPRELHVDDALACITFGPAETSAFEPRTVIERGGAHTTTLVHCPFFQMDEQRAPRGYVEALAGGRPAVWMTIRGRGVIRPDTAAWDPVALGPGRTVLLPAALDAARLEVVEDLTLLHVGLPSGPPAPAPRDGLRA